MNFFCVKKYFKLFTIFFHFSYRNVKNSWELEMFITGKKIITGLLTEVPMIQLSVACLIIENTINYTYLRGDQAAEDDGNVYLHLLMLLKATSAEIVETVSQFILLK